MAAVEVVIGLFASALVSCGPAALVGASPESDPGDAPAMDVTGGPKLERCGDGVDDDLDGDVDEGCGCQIGDVQDCWFGPRFARGQGICHDGRQVCLRGEDGSLAWDACQGSGQPELEDCADGEDDDCDGRTDCEDPDCATACGAPSDPGGQQGQEPCGSEAPCGEPTQPEPTDDDGDGNGCAQEELDCGDGSDDDCDGAVDCDDTDCAGPCGWDGEGGEECADVEQDCGDGRDEDCDGQADCTDPDCACGDDGERCNGLDDDGDGRTDEGRACGDAGDGGDACEPGALRICDAYCGVHQRCNDDGSWGVCTVDAVCGAVSQCTSHAECPHGDWCDFGWCVSGTPWGLACDDDFGCDAGQWCAVEQGVCVADCLSHGDCPQGSVCDLGACVEDPYVPGRC